MWSDFLMASVHTVNPYVRRYRVHLAALFGYIFWKTRKIVKMMNFGHLRVAKSLEKYILFDKNCLPGKKHQQTSSPNLQSWPFWIAGLIRLDLCNFDPWKNMLRLEKKFQTIFSIISMGNVVYYHQEHAYNSFFEGEWEFLKSGVIRRHLPTFNHFGDLEVPRSHLVPPKWWILSIRGLQNQWKGYINW